MVGRHEELDAVRAYVGTDLESGPTHLEILRREGMRPESSLLEIGCGGLAAAIAFVRFLEPNRYVGMDPNEWLRAARLRSWRTRRLMARSGVRFLTRDDFDASELGRRFDFVFAHSVLSHASRAQLPAFLVRARDVLTPGGKIVASLRLADGNEFGNEGAPGDSNDDEWVYPDVSWFEWATVAREAAAAGLDVRLAPEHTRLLTSVQPDQCHDWFVATPEVSTAWFDADR